MGRNLVDFIRSLGAEKAPKTTEQVNETPSVNDEQELQEETKAVEKKKINNADILEYVTEHFKAEMMDKSFKNVITFPMSFTVILNQRDYDTFKDYSRIVSKHIVLSFYEAIKEVMTEGKVCEPLATYWNISFLQCDDEPLEVNDKIVQVEEGDYYICSTVHDKLTDQVATSKTGGSTISVSKGGSTLFANVNINKESLDSLRIIDDTHIQMDWDDRMSEVYISGTPATPKVSIAVGKLCSQGKEYMIQGGTTILSGAKETRKDKNIIKVNSVFVQNGHVQIQYMDKEDKFKIAAFAETELNGVPMPVSTSNDKQWKDLQDGMVIDLAGDVTLTFKKMI